MTCFNNYARRLLNLPLLYVHYHLWRVHPRRLIHTRYGQSIDRPIFLLGVQGGGLTLVARMLRRHPYAVSVTGNSTYWAGPDEMQNVMGPYLPGELTGLYHKKPRYPKYPSRDWLYATDELLPLYRRTDAHASEQTARRLRSAISIAIAVHARHKQPVRFVDKSQSFTVRLSFVNELLRETAPRFLVIVRNPYAMCYRAALKKTPISRLPLPAEERLRLASEHWANSYRCVLEDAHKAANLKMIRFEDLLAAPSDYLQEICAFVDLEFQPSMLPAPEQHIPLGSTGSSSGDGKWYPIHPNTNQHYLDQLEPWIVNIVDRRVKDLAGRWGYTPEGP